MPTMNILEILPLQLSLRPDLGVDIVCDDPCACLDEATGILTISLPVARKSPKPGKEAVPLVVNDLAPFGGFHYYVSMYSGAGADELVAWKRDGKASRSPDLGAPAVVEVWATVLAVPQGNPAGARVYKGRRNVKVDYQGGGDVNLF